MLNGVWIVLPDEAVLPAALESFYIDIVVLNDENTQNELNLIDEPDKFIEYEDFKKNAEENYRQDKICPQNMA